MGEGWSFYNPFWNFGSGSNLRAGTNPSYTVADFVAFYPQFGTDSNGNYVVPQTVIQTFIDMAGASIQQARWRGAWQVAMGLFVAHFCTLYLQTSADPNSGAAAVFEAGRAQGVLSGESVGDVSYSADSSVTSVDGWAEWNATEYGKQLATLARMYGKGGMQIW
ncbi:DUF4054 domain-containing protein [Alicyclobacillus acidoterrestris]|uniref:DUF4054 domain-containing protein n=1 Tax=Alicyclobacillus acidoterrestris TaxID=1450 RepID=UPI003F532AA2